MSPQTKLTTDIGTLIHAAGKQELAGDYERAVATWEQVTRRLEDEYGTESWQAKNAELSVQLAKRRSQFSIEDRVKSLEISDLERQAGIDLAAQRLDAARQCVELAIGKATELWGANSHITLNLKAKRASFASLDGDDATAYADLVDVVDGRSAVLGKVHPDTLSAMQDLSAVCQRLQQFDSAVRWASAAIEVASELEGAESAEVAKQTNNLGVILYFAQDYDRAIRHLNQALELRTRLLGAESAEVGHSLYNLGLAKLAKGQVNEAEIDFATAQEIFRQDSSLYAALAQAHVQLGTVQMVRNAFDQAEVEFRAARAVLDEHRDEVELELADACFKLGVALGKQGKYPSAEIQLRDALEIQRRRLPLGHPQLSQTEEVYAIVQSKVSDIRTGQRPGTLQR